MGPTCLHNSKGLKITLHIERWHWMCFGFNQAFQTFPLSKAFFLYKELELKPFSIGQLEKNLIANIYCFSIWLLYVGSWSHEPNFSLSLLERFVSMIFLVSNESGYHQRLFTFSAFFPLIAVGSGLVRKKQNSGGH